MRRKPSWTCIEGHHEECTHNKCECGCHPYDFVTPDPDDQPYATYAEYLRHPHFLRIRAQVFERAAGRCERCGIRPPTEPHHLWYPPWGTFDVPENMIAVCHPCHCNFHGVDF